ncbi:hypothetical protein [Pseudoduganella violacea]|uniref:Uncharacterized protein n=1 Tax=Pseudoduganella violacea TaxID=1715466 RepID=A0A7W5BBH8_9BURK|nr:hypothetical protein [Pseudoduganella violacea]MBB3120107.1 hypothetical protein [Pseudoduganella violacea]
MLTIYHSSRRVRAGVGLAALCITALLPLSVAADERRSCFAVKAKIGSTAPPLLATGEVLRQAALQATLDKKNADTALQPQALPTNPRRCTGVNPEIPNTPPGATNYFGDFKNKTKFRQLVKMTCDGTGLTAHYFSMGKAIYYRSCLGGEHNNYVYFWGKQDGNASTCFGSTYPEMYELADSLKSNPLTLDRVQAVYGGGGGITGDDQSTYALGNIMAAILVSEATRDNLVIPANYMLMDQVAAGKATLAQVLAGNCVVGASTCGNTKKRDGLHPLAWGGAQSVMMTGGWGTSNGATSEFGKAFETDLTVSWLKSQDKVAPAASGCDATRILINYGPDQQTTLKGLFGKLF